MIVRYTELSQEAGGPRPLLRVAVGDVDDILVPCLVDSGATDSLLPAWAAELAGLDLGGGPARTIAVAARAVDARFATVRLTAGGHSWEAEVGFCEPWPYEWGILGQRSFFRWFTVTFRAADLELEAVPVPA